MLQASSVLIIGDSHVRRLQEVSHLLHNHLQDVVIKWVHRGGADITFAESNVHRARGHQLVIVMLGGNDIANGTSPEDLATQTGRLVDNLHLQGPDNVIVPSIWPRQSRSFNDRIMRYADIMESRHYRDPVLTFWRWDNRQPWRTYDGVHLLRRGYERATRTLVAMIVWAINHNQW